MKPICHRWMEVSYFTAEKAGINQNGKSDGVLALAQGAAVLFFTW